VLYAGDRQACFFECLAQFRPALTDVSDSGITGPWIESRRIATFVVIDEDGIGRWLDLTAPQSYAEFRNVFSVELDHAGLSDFDVSAATSDKRVLTQAIAVWAFERGYWGIRYVTRHAPHLYCWAIFESVTLKTVEPPSPILAIDDDFQAVAQQWGLDYSE